VIEADAYLVSWGPDLHWYVGSDGVHKRIMIEPGRADGRIVGTFAEISGGPVGVEFSTYEGAPVVIREW